MTINTIKLWSTKKKNESLSAQKGAKRETLFY